MTAHPTRRVVAAGGVILLGAGPALAKPGHIRPDLYAWENGVDPVLEFPTASMGPSVQIAPKGERGELFELSGRVTSWDRNAPVADVVIFAYHTDIGGLYVPTPGTAPRYMRARLRGWAKTGADGRYRFQSIKPGVYPSGSEPSHVHLTVFEPGRRPYWIDNAVFEGEEGVDAKFMAAQRLRGGSGIGRIARTRDGVWMATRDIRLERHPA